MSDNVPIDPRTRAADADRDTVAAQLRDAHVEGRLSAEELTSRIEAAYSAQTYGELEPLVRDLPASGRTNGGRSVGVPSRPPAQRDLARTDGNRTGMDKAMRILWATWGCAVGINLVIWFLVSLTGGDLAYFWPIWVAGPWAAVLACMEVIRRAARG